MCSYLCEAEGWSVAAAMEAFAAVRPPGVKHAKFIDELYARYGTSQQGDQPPHIPEASSSSVPVTEYVCNQFLPGLTTWLSYNGPIRASIRGACRRIAIQTPPLLMAQLMYPGWVLLTYPTYNSAHFSTHSLASFWHVVVARTV